MDESERRGAEERARGTDFAVAARVDYSKCCGVAGRQGQCCGGLKVEGRLSDDVTPDPTTQKNTQANSPETQSLASNNFDLGSSLLLNDDNESFKDQLSNCCHSDYPRYPEVTQQPLLDENLQIKGAP